MRESDIYKKQLLIGYCPDYFLRSELKSNSGKSPQNNVHQASIHIEYKRLVQVAIRQREALFKKRYCVDFQQNLKKAKNGHHGAISRLLEWDISYLFEDWLKLKALAAWAADSKTGRQLLDTLADAIKSRRVKGRPRRPELVSQFKLLKVSGFNFNDSKDVERLRKQREAFLEKSGIPENDPEYRILDKEYFPKWLKRNHLRAGH